MRRALLPVLLVLLAAAPARAATLPDPVARGPLGYKLIDYDLGTTTVTSEPVTNPATGTTSGTGSAGASYAAELRGEVTLPTGAQGPFPLIILEHGNHSTCVVGGQEVPAGGSSCPNTPSSSELPSYIGYRYLTEFLASHGYASVSLDLNDVNTYGAADQSKGMRERAQLIAITLGRLQTANTSAAQSTPGQMGFGSQLEGKLDLTRLGLFGHSRGGEGVTRFIQYEREEDGGKWLPDIKAVMNYAGVDYNVNVPFGNTTANGPGLAYGAYEPRCDGDVYDNQSTFEWDRGRFVGDQTGPRVIFNVNGEDHDFGNEQWFNDDYTGTGTACDPAHTTGASGATGTTGAGATASIRLTRPEQEQNTIALAGSFLRRYVGPEPDLDPYMTGAALLSGDACPSRGCQNLYAVGYLAPLAQRDLLIRPEEGAAALTTAHDGGTLAQTGLATYSACTPVYSGGDGTGNGSTRDPGTSSGCPNVRTRSRARQLTLGWTGPSTLTVTPQVRDVSAYDALSFRVGVNFSDARNYKDPEDEHGFPGGQDFDVALTDGDGHTATLRAGEYGSAALQTPAPGGSDQQGVLLGGVRLPLSAFTGVDLADVRSVQLQFGGERKQGAIELTELAFQEPVVPAGTGPTGATGTTTVTGPAGPSGPGGATGASGQNGAPGAGSTGEDGASGENGATGQNGAGGQNGASGQDGTGGQGAAGAPGSAGAAGPDGTPGAPGQDVTVAGPPSPGSTTTVVETTAPPAATPKTAFRASVAADKTLRRTVARRGLRVRVRCSAACTATTRILVDAKTARKLKLKSRVVGRVTLRFARAGRTTRRVKVKLKPTSLGAAKLSLRTTIRTSAGTAKTVSRKVALAGRV